MLMYVLDLQDTDNPFGQTVLSRQILHWRDLPLSSRNTSEDHRRDIKTSAPLQRMCGGCFWKVSNRRRRSQGSKQTTNALLQMYFRITFCNPLGTGQVRSFKCEPPCPSPREHRQHSFRKSKLSVQSSKVQSGKMGPAARNLELLKGLLRLR